jgi:hypothetical protein
MRSRRKSSGSFEGGNDTIPWISSAKLLLILIPIFLAPLASPFVTRQIAEPKTVIQSLLDLFATMSR